MNQPAPMPCMIRPALFLTAAILSGSLLSGCSASPATGQMQLNAMSEADEISMGLEAAPQVIKQYGGLISDPQIQNYVSRVGQAMAMRSERPHLPWKFHALNSPIINAFALPGGQIFISRGLMEKLHDEAEMAAVLGHEIGHVTDRHIGQRITQAILLDTGLRVAGGAGAQNWTVIVGSVAGQGYLLQFSRENESASDALSLRYLRDSDYDPAAMTGVLRVLAAEGSGGWEIMQTHPNPARRLADAEKLLKEQGLNARTNSQYQRNADVYKQEVLNKLKALPPAKQPKMK